MIESLVFVAALSIDGFVACFAYGTERIRIPTRSALVIDLVSTVMLVVALALGAVVRSFIPAGVLKFLCFSILVLLGLFKCFDQLIKSVIRHKHCPFLLSVYADPSAADSDNSKILSAKESFSIAFALSLDGLAAGFGAALGGTNVMVLTAFALIVNWISIVAGAALGNRIAKKIPLNLSWLGGIILIVLALLKL